MGTVISLYLSAMPCNFFYSLIYQSIRSEFLRLMSFRRNYFTENQIILMQENSFPYILYMCVYNYFGLAFPAPPAHTFLLVLASIFPYKMYLNSFPVLLFGRDRRKTFFCSFWVVSIFVAWCCFLLCLWFLIIFFGFLLLFCLFYLGVFVCLLKFLDNLYVIC